MSEDKADQFSKTAMWKKSISAENQRLGSWTGKVSLLLLTLGAAIVVCTAVYFLLR